MNKLGFKGFVISFFLIVLMIINASAQSVSSNAALGIAREVVEQSFPESWGKNKSDINIRGNYKSDLPFFVCDVDGGGFVLVAKDKKCPPVLGFSYEGSFLPDLNNSPGIIQVIIESMKKQCDLYINGRDTLANAEELWAGYSGRKSLNNTKTMFIPPLLKTKWKADSSFCAEFPQGSMDNASAVIAMGQVFRYFGEPVMGIGEFCYFYGSGQEEICTDFTYMFDFDAMPDNVSDEQVTRLLYYMAMIGKLQPGGANLMTYKETLPQHFFYSNKMRKLEYWEHDFVPVLKHQLAMKRPVPAEWKGLNFVIDGYYDTDFFHFNFGMGGELDGFYFVDPPKVTTDRDYFLLSCYVNYHPESRLPEPENLNMTAAGDSIQVSWTISMPDSLGPAFQKYILLRDGVIPILETRSNSIMVHPADLGISSEINCIAVFNNYGASELSEPKKYISDYTLADIPSLELRQAINIALGYTENLNRIPYVGELEMVKKLEIDFEDQRGINQLSQLKFLFIDGIAISGISDGDYLNSLNYILFHRCRLFDFTVFENTEALNVIQGSDGLPYDFYDLRHNSDASVITFASHDQIINNCGDLYGADRYFKNLTFFDIYHITYLTIDSCYISYESYKDVLPHIKGAEAAMEHTSPSSFAPCYPSPVRNSNVPNTGQISWQSNFNDEPNVFYNVYIGKTRDQLELVAPFYTATSLDYNFENNLDYYWRVESFHNDTTYYSGIFHFSTLETFPMPFEEDFDNYYAKCDVSYESPWWVNFGEELPEPGLTSKVIKRSGRYALEFGKSSDAGIIIPAEKDSAYQVDFYFRNNKAEFGIELLQGSNGGDTLAVNSRIGLYGDNLGSFNYGDGSGQFIFNASEWNHASIFLDMPAGLGVLNINGEEVSRWNWNLQKDGSQNTNPFRGIRFTNAGASGSGLIDDIRLSFAKTTGIDNIKFEQADVSYSSLNHELIILDNTMEIASLEIIDLRGRKIITFACNGEHTIKLDEGMPNGVFIVQMIKKDGSLIAKKVSVLR